uniref:Uncharacterized protein n=1 Tax=Cyprinus carpio TaxID=7962 RepID=A0A8C1J5J8_CYPCA
TEKTQGQGTGQDCRGVEEAYKRIQNPACIIVDASPSPQEVLQQVQHLFRNKCHM